MKQIQIFDIDSEESCHEASGDDMDQAAQLIHQEFVLAALEYSETEDEMIENCPDRFNDFADLREFCNGADFVIKSI